MIEFILRRLLLAIPTLLFIAIVSFIIINAPPGDYVSVYITSLEAMGELVPPEEIEALKVMYGVDKPVVVQFFKWFRGVLTGNLGVSLSLRKPVTRVILDRLPWSFAISFSSFLFVYFIGVPIGVLSATRQYSIHDYLFTFIGFIGIATPNFMLALMAMWYYFTSTGRVMIGLFSPEFLMASWSWGKLIDMLRHMWIPAIIVGTAGTAGLIRTVRANLLDELRKPYVMVAHAKGLRRTAVLFHYPLRIAVNPIMSSIGWRLPQLVSGEIMVSLVMGIPTLAPVLVNALKSQDMYLAGGVILVLASLTVIGTIVSDILLGIVDPRIRQGF